MHAIDFTGRLAGVRRHRSLRYSLAAQDCFRGKMKVIRGIVLASCIVLPLALQAATPSKTNIYAGDEARMLDVHTPTAERKRLFDGYEHSAQNGNASDQYLVGSLYRVGQQLPNSPVARDLNKASLYLSNAAARGNVYAMAKMAEIDLESGDYLQAMNWAQLYAHYSSLLPEDDRPAPGYLAELINRISKKYDSHKDADVLKDVNQFIAAYDAGIRAELDHGYLQVFSDDNPMKETSSRERNMSLHQRLDPAFDEAVPMAGFADYVVAFKPDGTASEAWPIDVVPSTGLNEKLRPYAMAITVSPATNKADVALRYAATPIILDDHRFKLSPSH
jgi:hypothetical protein